VDDVEVDPAIRAEIEATLEREGLPALVGRLRALNPAGVGPLDVRNPRRVVRALERCLATGRTLAELQASFAAQPDPFAAFERHVVEIVREAADLRRRIARRVDAMLEAGLVAEVQALQQAGLEQNPSAARAIGYRETLAWLREGARDRAQLAATIAQNTWRLVRKQRTWFRTQLPPHRTLAVAPNCEAAAPDLFVL
jgi:tRNA dimethylallyltransferase